MPCFDVWRTVDLKDGYLEDLNILWGKKEHKVSPGCFEESSLGLIDVIPLGLH